MLRTRVQVGGTVTGAAVMTHYWLGTDDAAHGVAVRNELSAFLTTLQVNFRSGTTFDLEPEAEIVDPATGVITGTVPLTALSVVGSASDEQLPLAVQGLIRWRTGSFISGRELRGRTFLPSPTEFSNNVGRPSSGYISGCTAAAQAMADDVDAGLAIWSRKHGRAHTVTTASVWNQWAQLRSRRD